MRASGLLIILAISGSAAAQTTDRTTCQQIGSQIECTTRHYEPPPRPDFHFQVPDIAGAFERGRAEARQRQQMELQQEQMQLQNQLLRQQLEQQERASRSLASAEDHTLAIMQSCVGSSGEVEKQRQCFAERYVNDALFAKGMDSLLLSSDTIETRAMKNDLIARVTKLKGPHEAATQSP